MATETTSSQRNFHILNLYSSQLIHNYQEIISKSNLKMKTKIQLCTPDDFIRIRSNKFTVILTYMFNRIFHGIRGRERNVKKMNCNNPKQIPNETVWPKKLLHTNMTNSVLSVGVFLVYIFTSKERKLASHMI